MGKYIKAQTVIIIAAVCGIVVMVHRPALGAKALSFDDQQYLTKNVLVQNPGLQVGEAVFDGGPGAFDGGGVLSAFGDDFADDR